MLASAIISLISSPLHPPSTSSLHLVTRMGPQLTGTTLRWSDVKALAGFVRERGLQQLVRILARRGHGDYPLLFGDEVEYMLVSFDHVARRARLLFNAEELANDLRAMDEEANPGHPSRWHLEFSSYMLEGIPAQPYGGSMAELTSVETSMRLRRRDVLARLHANETICSLTAFPRLGCPGFSQPEFVPQHRDGIFTSLFLPDEAIVGHARYTALARNIRERRGENIVVNVPIFRDRNTPSPFIDKIPDGDEEAAIAVKADHIYMDAMGFGAGNCCLQVTMQARNIEDARHIYDQLALLCPIMMALSAAAPFYRGLVSDVDCRWSINSVACDDRTRQERGLEPLTTCKWRIPKSRFNSIESFLSPGGAKFNDLELPKDEDVHLQLLDAGIDPLLARHFAHVFLRDPLVILWEKIYADDDENEDYHFECIQGTCWQTLRLKPPPPNTNIGWRVEFRPMDVQLTDFENAAYVVFVVLLTRVIVSYGLNFLVPLSKIDQNIKKAQKRNAVLEEMFYFRKDIQAEMDAPPADGTESEVGILMSIDTIINGKVGVFQGLVPIVYSFLEDMEVDVETRCTISHYLELISKRASGELGTTAQRLRAFVSGHPDYAHDSVISERVNYDLLLRCDALARAQPHGHGTDPLHELSHGACQTG
ncbi:glutamate--cysteine ligase catalytic subunit-like isoform X1 [Lampetra planeri]